MKKLMLACCFAFSSSPLLAALPLSNFLEEVYQRRVADDPMLATTMGLSQDKDRWPDFSEVAEQRRLQAVKADLKRLRADYDYKKLSVDEQLNYAAFEADLQLRLNRDKWKLHFNPINQIVGIHLQIAGTLMTYHGIDNKADAQAYIARLERVSGPIDGVIGQIRRREAKGFYLPASVIPRLIQSAQSLSSFGNDGNVILNDFSRKLAGLSISDSDKANLERAAEAAFKAHFVPAYQALIDQLNVSLTVESKPTGVWQMVDGDAFYAFLIRQFTTTDITPGEVHELGLAEVAKIHAEMNRIREKVGFEGDLFEFFEFLETSPQFYFADSDEGRQRYLDAAQSIVDKALATIPQILPEKLDSQLVLKRVEAYREKSAPIGFYEAENPAQNKPGVIYLGLYNMAAASSFDLNALLYHEGVPGHHLQSAVMQREASIPNLRKYYVWWSNTAFTEGWALYGEYLAQEFNLYPDPYSEFGRLAGELWRACRLVVDSGLHAKRWSRQEAIEYLNKNTAGSVENNERAVDRYLAVPGQATAFKVGMMKIIALREKASSALGEKFEQRQFHYLVLKHGPLPLDLLEQEVDNWIANQQVLANAPTHKEESK